MLFKPLTTSNKCEEGNLQYLMVLRVEYKRYNFTPLECIIICQQM